MDWKISKDWTTVYSGAEQSSVRTATDQRAEKTINKTLRLQVNISYRKIQTMSSINLYFKRMQYSSPTLIANKKIKNS